MQRARFGILRRKLDAAGPCYRRLHLGPHETHRPCRTHGLIGAGRVGRVWYSANTDGGGAQVHVPAGCAQQRRTMRPLFQRPSFLKYQDALDASSTDQAMLFYMDDGVFMRPRLQSAIGKAQLHRAYGRRIPSEHAAYQFTLPNRTMSPEWAFARTDSAGTNKINTTGAISAEGRKDLFIFHKDAAVLEDCALQLLEHRSTATLNAFIARRAGLPQCRCPSSRGSRQVKPQGTAADTRCALIALLRNALSSLTRSSSSPSDWHTSSSHRSERCWLCGRKCRNM